MGKEDDDWASDGQIHTVGITGCCIYCIMATVTGYYAIKTHDPLAEKAYARNMFICAFICCILELPRWIVMVHTSEYTNQWVYGFHVFSGAFFFAAYTNLCLIFQYISESTTQMKLPASSSFNIFTLDKAKCMELMTARRCFILLNAFIFLVALMSFSTCVASPSLKDYFDSTMYMVQNSLEIIVNTVVAISFFVLAIQLEKKLSNYIKTADELERLGKTVRKMIVTMTTCMLGFLLRVIMILVKIGRSDTGHAPGELITYSVGWFSLTDFVPRTMPMLSFVYLVDGSKSEDLEARGIIGTDEKRDRSWGKNFSEGWRMTWASNASGQGTTLATQNNVTGSAEYTGDNEIRLDVDVEQNKHVVNPLQKKKPGSEGPGCGDGDDGHDDTASDDSFEDLTGMEFRAARTSSGKSSKSSSTRHSAATSR